MLGMVFGLGICKFGEFLENVGDVRDIYLGNWFIF